MQDLFRQVFVLRGGVYRLLNIFLFSVLFLSLFSVGVFAQPFQTSDTTDSLRVVVPSQTFFAKQEVYNFAVRAFSPDGLILNNSSVSCRATFYSSDGEVLDDEVLIYNSTYNTFQQDMFVNGRGELDYIAYCSNSTAGGFTAGEFFITVDGRNLEFDGVFKFLLVFLFGALLFVFGKVFSDWTMGILGGFVWFLEGLYILINPIVGLSDWFSALVGSVLFGVGAYVWVRGSLENIDFNKFFG